MISGIYEERGILEPHVSGCAPGGIRLNLNERPVVIGLYPPGSASRIYNDLLSWACAMDASGNDVHLVLTALFRRWNLGKFD